MRNFEPTFSHEENAMIEYIDKHKEDIYFTDYNRETEEFDLILKFEFGEMSNCFIAKDYYQSFFMVLNDGAETWLIERKISKRLFDYLETLIERSRSDQLNKNHLVKIDTIFNG